MRITPFLFFAMILLGCSSNQNNLNYNSAETEIPISLIDSNENIIHKRYHLPENYERAVQAQDSYAYFLNHLPLKKIGTPVYCYNGSPKSNQSVVSAVINIDIGNKNLQQCADAVMRLRSEYLYQQKLYDQIHFKFTNGFNAEYKKWAEGFRIQVQGNQVKWIKQKSKDYSYPTFRTYLEQVFSYAGTASLEKELQPVSIDSIQIGDVFIHGGSPGHAVIVVDLAEETETGKKIFMLAQSYMPAQDIHILINPNNKQISPWYSSTNSRIISTPEWTFSTSELKRFP